MFQKKEYIYSETMGVCLVADVTNLAPKKGNAVSYYVLRSAYQKEKVAYIPVENHAVELRELIDIEKAKELAAISEIPEGMTEEQFLLRKGEVEFVLKREELFNSRKNDKKKNRNSIKDRP